MTELLHDIGHGLNLVLGTGSQDSWAYKFWSAPATAFIIGGSMYTWYKHNKCEYCFRLGHHVAHAHKPRCVKHKEARQADTSVLA